MEGEVGRSAAASLSRLVQRFLEGSARRVLAGVWSEQVPVQDGDRGSGGLLTLFVRETRSREI